jgi:cytochrome c biogenesis protein
LNLIVCSVDRFPATWKRFKASPRPDRRRLFEDAPSSHSVLTAESVESAARLVGGLLRSRFRNLRAKEAEGVEYFYGEKGRYSLFGVYLIHLSVLVILLGGLTGSFLGFEAYVNIVEGDQVSEVRLRNTGNPVELEFDVRCDRFVVEFYENGAPKEYRSDLTFLVDGTEADRQSALVNHPVQFRGITFYQASYGQVPAGRIHMRLSDGPLGTDGLKIKVEPQTAVPLPGNQGYFEVLDARSDFMRMGPAVLVSLHPKDGEPKEIWVFQNGEEIEKRFPGFLSKFPKFNPSALKPYTFFLEDLESRYYTGLQVNRDPGVPLVWAGCFLMVAGFMVAFFMSHRGTWVRVAADGNGSRVTVAGMAGKNPVLMERELERLTHEIGGLFRHEGKMV